MTLELAAYLLLYSPVGNSSVPWKSDGHSIQGQQGGKSQNSFIVKTDTRFVI